MDDTSVSWKATNLLLILSNVAFLLPAIPCFRARKYVAGTFFICTCIASSIYHTCKWGSEDKKGFGGYCVAGLTFEMTYAMDFFFSQMAIPIAAGFFINPKTALSNIEERYKTWLKGHRHTHHSNDSSFSKPKHYYELKFNNQRTLTGAQQYQQPPPWILCHYNIDDHTLTILRSMSKRTNIMSTTETTGIVEGEKIKSGEPEIWCKTCNEKVNCYRMKEEKGFTIPSHARFKCQRFGYLDGYYYCDVSSSVKQKLGYLESFYILFHVFVIAFAIKLVGPSFYNLTVPLIMYNLLVIFLLLWVSYLSEVRLYLKKKLCKEYLTTLGLTLQNDNEVFFCSDSDTKEILAKKATVIALNSTPSKTITQQQQHSHKNNRLGRVIWGLVRGSNRNIRVRILLKILPKRSLLGVDVLKSLEWALGIHKLQHKKTYETKQNNILYTDILSFKKMYFTLSLMVALIAILLFATQNIQPQSAYSWTHSTWHVLGPLGLYIIFDLVL